MKCGRNGAAALLVIVWRSSIKCKYPRPLGWLTHRFAAEACHRRDGTLSVVFRFVPALNQRPGWEDHQAAWDEPMRPYDEARRHRPKSLLGPVSVHPEFAIERHGKREALRTISHLDRVREPF